jgi:hypothetical protein
VVNQSPACPIGHAVLTVGTPPGADEEACTRLDQASKAAAAVGAEDVGRGVYRASLRCDVEVDAHPADRIE